MEAEHITPEFWLNVGCAEFLTLPHQRWVKMAPPTELESLVASGVMVDLPSSLLDGREDRYDFGAGTQAYLLEADGERFRAFPTCIGSSVEVSRYDARVLTVHLNRFLDFLATQNGFTPSERTPSKRRDVVEVGSTNLGGLQVSWLLCLDPSALSDPATLAYAKSLASESNRVVVSVPDMKTLPAIWASQRSIVPVSYPTSSTCWALDRRSFCRPELGLLAKYAAKQLYQYSHVSLFIAERENSVFLYGHDLELKGGTRPFKYLSELAKYSPSEVDSAMFTNDTLKYSHHSDPLQAAYEDQKAIRNAIKRAITDEDLQAKALGLFKSLKSGFFALPLEVNEIFRW